MLKKIAIAASTGVLGLSMLAGASTLVSAQEQSESGINFFERLASKLGISSDELSDASKEVEYEIIDEKVASGELDSERAEEIKQRIEKSEDGNRFFGFGIPGKEMHVMKFEGIPPFLADFLDISEEEVEALKAEELNMDEILEKYGKTKEEFHEYMKENRPFMGPKLDMMADFLGISVEEIEGLKAEGLNGDEILEKYGKTDEDFRAYMKENMPDKPMIFKYRNDDGEMGMMTEDTLILNN